MNYNQLIYKGMRSPWVGAQHIGNAAVEAFDHAVVRYLQDETLTAAPRQDDPRGRIFGLRLAAEF